MDTGSLVEGGHLGKRLTREERERAARSSGTVLLRLSSSNNGRQGTWRREASIAGDTSEIRVTRGQQVFASWVTDVLVFIVVLNLFVEYVPRVITESFTISIFTAVVLKLLIDAIARLEHHVSGWFKRREGSGWRLLGLVTMFAILFFSKFVVLEVIDIVFGDRVTLGGFIEVLVLVLTMILARLGLTWTYRRLGEQGDRDARS